MATPATRSATRSPIGFIALLLVLAAAAAAAGAYLDWIWWHPTKGIVVTIAAIGSLVVAAALALARRPLTTRLALAGLAIGAGLLIGQALGPSREALQLTGGTMTVRLDSPLTGSATGPADCQTVPSGEHLQVSGDVNTRLDVTGLDPAHAPTVVPGVSFGDMWAPDSGRRSDEVVVTLYANSAMIADDGGPTELRLRSTPASTLTVERAGDSGTIHFGGLEVTEGTASAVLGSEGEVSGTIEWTCPTG